MKNLFYFLFLSTFILTSCGGEKTEEDLANEVFQTFLDDNPRAFKKLYVTQMDIENMLEESNIPDEMKNDYRKMLRGKTAFWRTISKLAFRNVRIRAFEHGVNWQNAEITKITSEESGFQFFSIERDLVTKYGLQVKDIHIEFVSDKDTFNMKLDDCVKTSRGWALSEEVRINRKSKYDF